MIQRRFIIFLFPILFACKNSLIGKPQTVQLSSISWACDCANWIEPDTAAKYEKSGADTLADHCVFIEPADSSLQLPDTLGYNNDVIVFTGQYYEHKGFPKDQYSNEPVDKARVFRYSSYKIIESHHWASVQNLKK